MARQSTFTLSTGALVAQGLSTYMRNLLPFTLLSALVLSPWIAFRLLVQADAGAHGEPSALPLLGALIQGLLTNILTGAVTYGVVMQLRGQPAGLAQVMAKGVQTFFSVLGTGFLCGMRILLLSLLVIPGIIQQVKLYVAIPAAVMEGKAGGDAIARSQDLTRGSGWQIFYAWLLVLLVSVGLMILVGALLISTKTMPAGFRIWFEIAIALVLNSFAATLMAVCYFQLRQGKENVDVKQLAAVFD